MRTSPTIWNSNREIYGDPAGMTPDWGFVRKLKELDPALDVVWNRHKERWIIIEKGHQSGRWHIVARVENPDQSYRDLDDRILRELRETKWRFDKGSKAFAKYLEETQEATLAKQWEDYDNEIHAIGDWYALQMMEIPHFQVPETYKDVKNVTPVLRGKGEASEKGSEANRRTDSNIASN